MTAAPRGQALEGVEPGDFVVSDNRRGVPQVLRVTRTTACYVMTGVDRAERAWRRDSGYKRGQDSSVWDRLAVRKPQPGEVQAIARTHRLSALLSDVCNRLNEIGRERAHPSPETIAAMEEVLKLLATVPPFPTTEDLGEATP